MRWLIPSITLTLLFLGLYFFGTGMTGQVTSQTCCLPPNCPEEYLCSAAGYGQREETAVMDARIGVLLMFAAATTFITHEMALRE